MKKVLIIIGVVAGILIVPVLGMAITPTRDLILGIAPKQAILKLADTIDENRINSDSKISELQSIIDTQQAKLTEQQQTIDSQSSQINSVKNESQSTQVKVNNEAECRKLYLDNPECKSAVYRTKSAFDKYIADTKKRISQNNTGEDIDAYKKTYSTCQSIIAKCG